MKREFDEGHFSGVKPTSPSPFQLLASPQFEPIYQPRMRAIHVLFDSVFTRTVDTCSGAVEASSERDDESAGQLVTVGAQLMTVRTWVDMTVKVVSSPPEEAVGTVPLPMGAGGALSALDATPVAAAAEETGKRVAVTVSSRSGSQVSSSSTGRVAFAGSAMAAPTATREKSRSEAKAPADWKRMVDM